MANYIPANKNIIGLINISKALAKFISKHYVFIESESTILVTEDITFRVKF